MLIIITAPVDEWDSQSELAFPDDGKLQNIKVTFYLNEGLKIFL